MKPGLVPRVRTSSAAWIAAFLAFGAARAPAATLHVPADRPTIASALAASAQGDTVLVSAGTYFENLVMSSGVALRAESAPGSVVIDGANGGAVIAASAPVLGTRLEGLVLRHGSGDLEFGVRVGGGLAVHGGEIDLVDVRIESSHADYGGGLFAERASVRWQNGALEANVAQNGDGGGFFTNGGSLRLVGLEIAFNQADAGAGGYALSSAPFSLLSSSVRNNVAALNGGGFYLSGSGVALNDSRLSGNRSGADGGGLYLAQGTTGTASYTTFLDNHAAGRGGAFFATCEGLAGAGCASLALFHADVLANQAPASGAGAVAGAASVTVEASVVAANQGTLTCFDPRASIDVRCTAAFGNGGTAAAGDCRIDFADTLAVDPHLCDLAAGDLHRCANSPLLSPSSCGLPYLGAWGLGCGNCGPTPSEKRSWGRLKASYR